MGFTGMVTALREPDGDKSWGIDDDDYAVTGNRINMDSYIEATQGYNDYCTANNIPTTVFFTTGPVDSYVDSEIAYQAYLKWEHLRDYINADASRVLFDYADILCWDDDGTPTTNTWNGHTYPHITTTNLGEANVGHIGNAGALRLGKAMWWMLARIAGWDGVPINTWSPNEEEIEGAKIKINMYPDKIGISCTEEFLNGLIRLYDTQGSLIETRNILNNITYLNASNLSVGSYFVVLSKDNNMEVVKIIWL